MKIIVELLKTDISGKIETCMKICAKNHAQ